MTTLIAGATAAAALLAAWPGAHGVAPPVRQTTGTSSWSRGTAAWGLLLFVVAGALLGRPVVGVGLAIAVAGVVLLLGRARLTGQANRVADGVAELCEALAADLGAGLPPATALVRSAAGRPGLDALATTARIGADVPTTLRRLARRPGGGDLDLVAAAWQVSETSGASLSDALRRARAGILERRRGRRLVQAELSAARATARLMAALPVLLGLAGAGLGGDPVGFLVSGPAGQACLVAGVALSLLGLLWLERIATPSR